MKHNLNDKTIPKLIKNTGGPKRKPLPNDQKGQSVLKFTYEI